ncbi:MAG: hypothetical protein FJX75_26055, partial [Armatimonadetes bacterium]|nr:hypothetical protein [Armatimonadota bacterium]
MQSDIHVRDIEITFADEVLRTPLKFGSGVVTATTSMTARVIVENGAGAVAEGFGNILLSDMWGFPSAVLSHEERDAAMREVGKRFAARVSQSGQAGHPTDLFLEAKADLAGIAEDVCDEAGLIEPMPILGALVCASPVDAA